MTDKKEAAPPNAAPASAIALLASWAEELGTSLDDVAKKADVDRTTLWRARSGKASAATAKRLREELEKIAEKRGLDPEGSLMSRVRVWSEMGMALAQLDREKFDLFFDRVKKVVDGEVAMQSIRNPLPPRDSE